uniref:Diphthamide biosynthesis protein 3 n=1 Tax=Equus caballus TaxID=9796 RepID=A0A5F5PR70_HORSE
LRHLHGDRYPVTHLASKSGATSLSVRRKRSFLRRCVVTTPAWAGARNVGPTGAAVGRQSHRRLRAPGTMAVFHDEVEIEDFQYDEDSETYFYPCPCGDNFCITKEDLENGEDVATCPSCSLIIKVIYDKVRGRI